MTFSVDLNESGSRINIRFPYSQRDLYRVKKLPGVRFKGPEKEPDKGEAYWYCKADIELARRIHDELEPEMGPSFKKWANTALRKMKELSGLSGALTAELQLLPDLNP